MESEKEFRYAPEVKRIAKDLIAEYHPHLLGAEIWYVFMNKTPISKGKAVWARVKKVTGLNAFLATIQTDDEEPAEPEPLFVMEVSYPVWLELKEHQRKALVDHELCHIGYDGEKDMPIIVGHDLEEFRAVVDRHGLWADDVKLFSQVVQEHLPFTTSKVAV